MKHYTKHPAKPSNKAIAAVLVLLTLAIVFGVWIARRYSVAPDGPNILLITLDTTRADRIGCYGYSRAETPWLDGLAAAGVLFEDAQSPVPITLPAHASILTGLLPPEHGLRVNGADALADSIPTLAEILKAQGYRTGAFIASPVLSSIYGLDRGFDRYDEETPFAKAAAPELEPRLDLDRQHEPYRPGTEVADAALAWLQQQDHGQRKQSAPFFVWAHFYDPHMPFHTHRERFGDRFEHPYDAEIAYMDLQIGRLLAYLDEAALKEDTLVVVVGDHGEGLGEQGEESHAYFLYRATQQVPLIMTWKNRLPPGKRVAHTVGITDVMPTILEAAGSRTEIYEPRNDPRNNSVRNLMAASFAPALHGEPIDPRTVYMETVWPFHQLGWAPLFAIVTDAWKYIRAPHPELFNRANDPLEETNLFEAEPRLADELAMLLESLEARALPLAVPEAVSLDADTQRRLASLGYTSGGQVHALPDDVSELRDVKDYKEIIVLQSAVRQRIESPANPAELLPDVQTLLAASPETGMFHDWHGLVLMRLEQYEEAVAAFEIALELTTDPVGIHNNLALCHAARGRMPDAIHHFEQAFQGKPHDPALRNNLATALTRTGTGYLRGGQPGLALELFERVIDLWPDQAGPLLNLGSALQQLGRRAEAETAFRRALEIDPEFQPAHQALRRLGAIPR